MHASKRSSIATKLLALNFVIVLMIVGLIATFVFSFRHIEQIMTRIVGRDVAQVIASAKAGRDLTDIFAETANIVAGFSEQDELLRTGKERLREMTDALFARHAGTALEGALQTYHAALQALLTQAETVSSVARSIETLNAQFDADFKELADVIAKTIVMVMMEGRDVAALERSSLDISWHQMTLLRVQIVLDQLIHEHLRVAVADEDHRGHLRKIVELLGELDVRLRPLAESEPDVRALGQRITEQVTHYQHALEGFHDELIRFQQQFSALNNAQQEVMAVMSAADAEVTTTTDAMQTQVTRVMRSSRNIALLFSAILLIVVAFGWFTMRRMITPLTQLTQVADALAGGDLTYAIPPARSHDEIGRLLLAMRAMMVEKLSTVVITVKTTADDVAQKSREMRGVAEMMSTGASNQAASSEEVSASIAQMAANIRQNSENASQTERIARSVAADAYASGQAVADAVEAMSMIAKKVSLIEEITAQTRMLSLNATIEAARAQEYGRGFAVVAAEIRNLAERTRAAATEITELVMSSSAVTEKAGQMLQTLVPDIQRTADLVQEINAASREQTAGVEQINRAVQQLDLVTQHNAATSEQLAATADHLATQAEGLQQTMAFFTVSEARSVV